MHIDDRLDDRLATGTAIYRSWASMKTGVMIWLWYLNAIYWFALLYLSEPEAFWAIIAYASIAPFIAVIAIRQRGLTRLSGFIHTPWLLFTIYLFLRLFTDVLGPALTPEIDAVYYWWLQVVFWSTLVCVLLDIWDIARWFNGERYVLGSVTAAMKGASKLAKTAP